MKKLTLLIILIFAIYSSSGCSSSSTANSTISTPSYPNGIGASNSNIYVVIGEPHAGPNSTPVSAGTTKSVEVYDFSGNHITSISVAGGGHGLRVTPDKSKVYIAHFSLDHQVTAISTSSNSVISTISSAINLPVPDAISISPDGTYAYVGCNNGSSGFLSRILISNNTIDAGWQKTVNGGYTCWVENHPGTSHAYVYTNSWTGSDIQRKEVSGTGDVSITLGSYPHAICFDKNGDHIYALVSGANIVRKIRVSDFTVLQDISGPWAGNWGGPVGAVLSLNGNYMYITNHELGYVAILDVNSGSSTYDQVVKTVQVGTHPIFLTISPDGNKLFVANNGNSTISIIDVTNYK